MREIVVSVLIFFSACGENVHLNIFGGDGGVLSSFSTLGVASIMFLMFV